MNVIVRVTSLVIVLGLLAASPGAQALAFVPRGNAQGCHDHTRSPMIPVSYQCCANGHNWAVAATPVVMAPPALCSHANTDSNWFHLPEPTVVTFLSSSPPNELPLRI